MRLNLKQDELAQGARARGQRREAKLSLGTTAYWYYPAAKRTAKTESLIMIHGYRGNHHGLEAIAGAITDLDIYIPDLPGFGKSAALRVEHSIANYAKWLSSFIDALELKKKPHLLGHSFGSIVVSAFAAKFDKISSLILENPVAAPALKGPKALTTAIAKAFFWFAEALPERFGNGLLKSWPMVRGMSVIMTKSRNAELRRWVHAQHDDNFNDFASRRVALEAYDASISNCVSDFAPKFKVPVLMLIGERDDITTVKQQQALFDIIETEDVRMLAFEKVGHLTHYEIPEAIAKAIEEWVSDANG